MARRRRNAGPRLDVAVHLNSERYTGDQIFWKVVVHITLITTAVSLGFLDRLTEKSGAKQSPPD